MGSITRQKLLDGIMQSNLRSSQAGTRVQGPMQAMQAPLGGPIQQTRLAIPPPPTKLAQTLPLNSIQTNSSPTALSPAPVGTSLIGTSKRSKQGWNQNAVDIMAKYTKSYGASNLGIIGDKAHKARKSDHNTGDAADLGVKSPEQGMKIVADVLKEPGVKYAIFGPSGDIYYPSGRIVRNGSKFSHASHVHVSFIH